MNTISSSFLPKRIIMLRWTSIFVLIFFIASIQSADVVVPELDWFVANTDFKYMALNDKGNEVPKRQQDMILMVRIGEKFVGSAQSFCRHINPPNEQIVLLQQSSKYDQYTNNDLRSVTLPHPLFACAPLTYGCITLVHNYCSIPTNFKNPNAKDAILSKSRPKPAAGTKLIGVHFNNHILTYTEVVVKDFKECEKVFDPESVYLVDAEEQLCTTRVSPISDDDPIGLPAALLFQEEKDEYYLIGIESKTSAAKNLSLSTFAPYHCNHGFEDKCSP